MGDPRLILGEHKEKRVLKAAPIIQRLKPIVQAFRVLYSNCSLLKFRATACTSGYGESSTLHLSSLSENDSLEADISSARS